MSKQVPSVWPVAYELPAYSEDVGARRIDALVTDSIVKIPKN